jgi:hypothetical protein
MSNYLTVILSEDYEEATSGLDVQGIAQSMVASGLDRETLSLLPIAGRCPAAAKEKPHRGGLRQDVEAETTEDGARRSFDIDVPGRIPPFID